MIGEEYMIMKFSKINILILTPLQVKSVLDLGYLGVQNDFPTIKTAVLPFRKKRKKGELSNEEKK